MRGPTDDERAVDADRRGKGSDSGRRGIADIPSTFSASSVGMSQLQVKMITTPFIPKILEAPLPVRFNMPFMETYNGTSDPVDHLRNFESTMLLYGYMDDHIMCRAFVNTLGGTARMWFIKLAPESVSSFEELTKLFVGFFILYKKPKKIPAIIMGIKQHKGESLRSYILLKNQGFN